MKLDLQRHPHRRFNPLTREWVLVSPQRTQRPWQGQVEKIPSEAPPQYDPNCYMCPANKRASGAVNPPYASTFVFDNDFPAMLPDTPALKEEQGGLLVAEGEPGLCRVICYSPRHDLTLSTLDEAAVAQVVDVWIAQFRELCARPGIRYVQIFENRGAMMGASNPHPHCQIWANCSLPNQLAREQQSFLDYKDSCLLCDYLELEVERRERVVIENRHFTVVVPFWAIWPFETMVLPRHHLTGLDQLSNIERQDLAAILHRLTAAYDRLFETSFPYSMGFHQRPTDGPHPEWHLHAHFLPPLLRSATV